MDLGSSDLELPNDGGTNQTVGVQFTGIDLDQGQVITSAHIQFEADEVQTGAITITIEGELENSADSYSSTALDVSGRTPTTATAISWSPTDWNSIGQAAAPQQTPDLTTLVQEIVNQAGWSNGNNMSFIFTGPAGNRRTAETDPILVIETTASFSLCGSSVAHQDFDFDGEDDFRDTDDDADGIATSAEIPDADGSGTPDYLEFDGDECGLGFLATAYTNDYTGIEASETGVINENNLPGTPNGTVTQFNSNNDEYVINFEQVYPAGYRYIITWREAASQSGTAEIVLSESDDNSVFNGRLVNPTTNSTTLFADTITSQNDFQYLRFRLEDGASSTDFEIDAVGVLVPTCEADSDDDGIVDSDDIDDDNDGVLDTDEGCAVDPFIEYAATETSQTGVGSSSEILGSPDEVFAEFHENDDIIVLDFGSIQAAGTSYRIYWRERTGQTGTATIVLEESTNNSAYNTHSNLPTTNSTDRVLTTVVSENSFRYLRMSKDNPPSSTDFQIDAVGVVLCTDTDGDGVPDSHDLDSDNDGIPDIQEAGGSAFDTDGDGRVDDPTDTDGDGWADDFDSTNGGTALDDDDKDGDGLENRIDIDADNDGIADIIEAGGVDIDNDGRVDSNTDTDEDGFADTFDNDNFGTPLPVTDEDGDGIQNYLDLDSDSDGITDNVEGQTTADFLAPLGSDTDGDGWDNRYDSDDGGTAIELSDNDGFGNPDYLDDDSDGDGLPDWMEGFDDNEDGDALDDLLGRATTFEDDASNPNYYVNTDDGDADGIPDWLEDDDGDNVPNFLDPDHTLYEDTDEDGIVDLYDTDDFGVASITPDNDGDGEYDFRDTDNEISLPVELLDFTAERKESYVHLKWTTVSEINNDYFEVQRLNENKQFEKIGEVNGAGNSNQALNYSFIDYEPIAGYNYYRLRQVDFDGKFEYSDLRSVYFSSQRNLKNGIFPNPSNGQILWIEFEGEYTDPLNWTIFDAQGRLIIAGNLNAVNGVYEKRNLLKDIRLESGIYFVSIQQGDQTTTKKLIIN